MSNVQSYNALIDRFKAFAAGHFILKRFSHGQIEVSDLEKFGEYPFMHVIPSNVTYSQGMKTFSFQIVLADLPRDKEDKSEYQREVLSDLQRIAEDLIAEITNHRVLFGDLITVQNVSLEPFLEEFQHTLTGWTISLDLLVPYYWDACSIPAEWNDFFESSTGGTGSILTFIDSITRDENGNVSLVNDEAEPSPHYYYGTNDEGVRGWYLLTDEVGLTCVTLPSCQTIIDIEAAIDLLQQDVNDLNADIALKANTADISAVGFSNDYDDLDNKPTIPTSLPPNGAAGGDLQGTYPNPTVHRVHGIDLQSGTPTADDVWVYGGSPAKWQHQHLSASQVDNDSSVTGTTTKLALEHLDSTKVPTTRSITINGTTEDLSANRTFNVGTVTSVAALTLGTTGTDLSSTVANGTTTPVITLNVPTASATNRGALSSADWSTFNGKFTLPSLTSGSVLFSNGTTIAQNNSQFYWDNTNSRLGIGTASPQDTFTVSGQLGNLTSELSVINTNGGKVTFRAGVLGVTNSGFTLLTAAADGTSETARLAVSSNGNLLIGTTTDAGYKLDVNGTARVQNHFYQSSGQAIISLGNNLNLRSNIQGGSGYIIDVQSYNTLNSTNNEQGFANFLGTYAPTSASGTPSFNALKVTPTINQTGGANGITRGLYINPTLTAAADFRAIEVASGGAYINTTSIAASAILQADSTTKGFLPPRQTQAQRTAIASPAVGLIVYQTDGVEGLYVRKSTGWAMASLI